MTLNPEDIEATICYIGRGWMAGTSTDRSMTSTVYSIALIDTAPPSPNPAEWHVEPAAYSDSSVDYVCATTGCDPKPGMEYMFTETTGKGHSSEWQSSPIYEDKGLKAGRNIHLHGQDARCRRQRDQAFRAEVGEIRGPGLLCGR